jgi:putative hydrolase of the HAD superfamily
MISTVIFDLDDTLYDEVDYCKSGLQAVAQCLWQSHPVLEAEEIFDAFWTEFTSGNRGKIFDNALKKLGISSDKKIMESLIEVYRLHQPSLSLPDDSRAILENLSKKYILALLTDGYLPAQQLKVAALGIERYFKSIMYTESLGREFWKPSPVGFEKLCATLESPYEKCVYVADNSKKDFIAPNSLGFGASIKIARGNRIHRFRAPSKIARASHTISSLSQLERLLERL